MVNFVVKGPFDVPTKEAMNGARFIDTSQLHVLTSASDGSINKAGCYVFSWKASRGSLPIYVGKATRKIISEAFNPRNLTNLAEFVNNRKRGRLQIYIIFQERMRLRSNKEAITEIEEFLIGRAAIRNPNLLNIHGTRPASWTIVGVANHGAGGLAAAVQEFKKTLGIVSHRRAQNRPTVTVSTEVIEPFDTESIPGPSEAELEDAPLRPDNGSDAQ